MKLPHIHITVKSICCAKIKNGVQISPPPSPPRLQKDAEGSVSADAHVIFTAADGRTLSFVDPAYSVNWYVGEWIPRAEEVAYKLADDGFRDSANPPDGLKPANHRQTFTPW